MGVWGTGLYSGDFAMDLKGAIGSVTRLPFGGEELLAAIRSIEPHAADQPDDPDHGNFWLIVADQFHKRGIDCVEARDRAIAIIESGADLEAKRALGLDEKSLASRRKLLLDLRRRLDEPLPAVPPRKTLKNPQRLLYEVGDIYLYPTCRGEPRNPYNVDPAWEWVKRWQQDGWGAMLFVERGLFLDHLAWYRPLVAGAAFADPPTISELLAPRHWYVGLPGTLTKAREKQLKMRRIGHVAVDHDSFAACFPNLPSPRSAAISDITVSRGMNVRDLAVHDAHRVAHGHRPTPRIDSLAEILA